MKWNDVIGTSTASTLSVAPQRAPLSPEDDRRIELKRLHIKKRALEEKLVDIESEAARHRRAFLLQLDPRNSQKN